MNILFDLMPDTQAAAPIKDLWFTAARNSELADPCCSEPPWCLSYHWASEYPRPVLLLFEHGNAICFCEEHFSGRTYLVPFESSWLYDRPILGQDPLPLFFTALDAIDEHYANRPYPFLVVGGIWPHHSFANELLLHFSHTFAFHRIAQHSQCSATLEGGLDTFLGNRSANFRQKLKKARRRCREAGITFERYKPTTTSESLALYERMLAIEHGSWKGMAKDGLLHPHSTPFYRYLVCELSQCGAARVIMAKAQDRDVGFIFGGLSNGIYRGQQFSYANDYASYSVGNVLQFEQISWLCEEKCSRYDMGPISGPRMEYKRHWTENIYPLECWLLTKVRQLKSVYVGRG